MNIEILYEKFLQCEGVATDTRKNIENTLFFCLKGDTFDANAFAEFALEKGAKFVVIDDENYAHLPNTILVENTLETLQKLANFHRKKLATPIIAITGSNGKTTSKELIFSVLSQSFNALCTQGNLNNHIGVPLTLLSITPKTDIAIVEMGANHPNEIAFLCEIAQPDFGYITNFGKAHLEGFGSVQGVIEAKSELYHFLIKRQKTIFFNADNAIQKEKLANYNDVFSFSRKENEGNILIKIKSIFPFLSLDFEGLTLQSHLVGEYNTDNIAVALTIGRYFKLSPQAIQRGIESYVPSNSRSQIIEKQNNNKILLDAYNANPSSMMVAIDNFSKIEYPKKIVILGDMKELGEQTDTEHQAVVDYLQSFSWNEVFLVGNSFGKTKNSFRHFSSFEEMSQNIGNQEFENTFFLIKGSRAMALERLVPLIK